jgi:kinetochore protein Nuf2
MLAYSSRFAKAARIDDFCAGDISHPERERTIDLLSAFINFIKFTEQCCDALVKALRDNSVGIITEREQVSHALMENRERVRAAE